MPSRNRFVGLSMLVALLSGMATGALCSAAEPTPPRAGMTKSRSGTTQAFGSGTITHRSDGSSSTTQRFGSGTMQRDQPARTRSGSGK